MTINIYNLLGLTCDRLNGDQFGENSFCMGLLETDGLPGKVTLLQ